MLSNTLNTNQVKDSTGAEVEFERMLTNERTSVFQKIGMQEALPHKMSIAHQESGTGMKRRRRSAFRVDLTSISGVDSVTPITDSAYIVLDRAVGASTSDTAATNVLANLLSAVASDGSDSTIKFNGTGTFASALIKGTL